MVASRGEQKLAVSPATSPPFRFSVTTTSATGPTTTVAPTVVVDVSTSPAHIVSGTVVTFTISIRGPGVLSGESATYGDGGTTGANAGLVKCGDTTNIDYAHIWQHAYRTPGSYQFADDVNVIGPPPSCRSITVTGKATVIVVG